jgi:hypothetical protein
MFPASPQITDDLARRYSHLMKGPGQNVFILPVENHLNRRLFHNLPTGNVDENGKLQKGGKMGQVKRFTIPTEKHNQILALFDQFKIPIHLQADLTGAYINMFFAKCTASYTNQFQKNFNSDKQNLAQAFDFLNSLEDEKINVTKISIEYQNVSQDPDDPNKRIFGEKQNKTFQGTMAVGLMEDTLQFFKDGPLYNVFKSFVENREEIDSFMGHQNSEKHLQDYYCYAIFEYLKTTLFSDLAQYLQNPEKLRKEKKRMQNIYSNNHLFWLIGELMLLAGLADIKDPVEDKIKDYIKKKLSPYIKSQKTRVKDIEEKNRNSKDGTYEVMMFQDLFLGREKQPAQKN